MNYLVPISDEWFIAISYSSLVFGIFVIKKWVVFSLTSFETLKYDCVLKIREIFSYQLLINNLVTMEFSFMLLILSEIKSSKTINILFSLSGL